MRGLILKSLLALLVVSSFMGCASQKETTDSSSSTTDSNGQPVSTIPWNRPQSWEGTGALGGMMGQ